MNIKNPCLCQFCLEFDGDSESIYNLLRPDVPCDRTVFSYRGFKVIPPLGQFVEGAVMIVSEKHYASCADLPEAYYRELECLLEIVSNVLTEKYQRPIFFEHGPPENSTKGKCCVDHAHIHAFPINLDIQNVLHLKYPFYEITKLSELQFFERGKEGYIFLQQDRLRYYYPCKRIQSQLIRKIIATELGVSDRGDWKNYLGLEEFNRTYETLKRMTWADYE